MVGGKKSTIKSCWCLNCDTNPSNVNLMFFNLLEQSKAVLRLKALHFAHELICVLCMVCRTSTGYFPSLVFVMNKKCVLSEGKLTF
jgi:hypothetical protein